MEIMMAPPRLSLLPPVTRIFVDRERPKQLFEDAAFSIPPHGAIIRVFFGPGGEGKTRLCQELYEKSDAAIEPSYGFLKRAHINLDGKPKTDPDMLLVWIRNEFARIGIALPSFDLALALMWEGARAEQPFPNLVKPWLGRSSGAIDGATDEAASWLGSDSAKDLIGEAIAEIPGMGFVLKRLGRWSFEKGKRLYLERTREHLKEMYRDGELRPAFELSKLLPWMLAQDLNFHLCANPDDRFVLFIDEYERVFDGAGSKALWTENAFDSHLREFVRYSNGLLCVFFSRETLPWSQDQDWRDDLVGHQYRIDGLPYDDANAFLEAVPVTDQAIRQAILEGARETSAPEALVYPLMLDLQLGHWQVLTHKGHVSPERFHIAADSFENRCQELISRVLRDYDAATQATIKRLSVARKFDRSTFNFVVTAFRTAVPLDSYDVLTELSFVNRLESGYFSLHKVVSSAIREMLTTEMRTETEQALFEHFSERAKAKANVNLTSANVEALFEASYYRRLVDANGFVEWLSEAAAPLDEMAMREANLSLWQDAVEFCDSASGVSQEDAAKAYTGLGTSFRELGNYSAAKPLLEHALVIAEATTGPTSLSASRCLNNLAAVLVDLGQYSDARHLYERALRISEELNGHQHRETGVLCNNLAMAIRELSDYGAARTLLEKALEIARTIEGEESDSTARCHGNLALILEDLADYSSARQHYEHALAIREKVNGPNHPLTSMALMHLASLLRDLREYNEALPLFERALAISETANGPEHPRTSETLNQLGWFHLDLKNYPAARPLLERAVRISKKVNGEDHPETGGQINNLALLLAGEGDNHGAKALMEEALAISEKSLGPTHPVTGSRLNNLADILKQTDELDLAISLQRRAVFISERSEGMAHPTTAVRFSNLAGLLLETNEVDEAGEKFEIALKISESANGKSHPMTTEILAGLSMAQSRKGNYTKAVLLMETVVRRLEIGDSQPTKSLCEALNLLGETYKKLGNLPRARHYAKRAVAASEIVNGSDHRTTGRYYCAFAAILLEMKDRRSALEPLRRGLEIAEAVYGPSHSEGIALLLAIAKTLDELDDAPAARIYWERCVELSQTAHGPRHQLTIHSIIALASCMTKIGERERAVQKLSTTLKILEIAPRGIEAQIELVEAALTKIRATQ
ncbi:hypothetical protein N182_35805 [Sinorhizobium sp. GL2]|nr:hypothetical protein N182_35805 [Sinorhizobium sp. GL2]